MSTRLDVGADETLQTSTSRQSHTLCEASSLIVRVEDDKMARNTLRTLNPNIYLTRLNVDGDLMKVGGSISVGRVSTESPLRRKLLTRRALNATQCPARCDDSTAAAKSKRHSASKTSSTCRCFGRPMVCSVCITRSVLSTCDVLLFKSNHQIKSN